MPINPDTMAIMKKALAGVLFFALVLICPAATRAANLGDVLNSPEMSQEKFFIGNTNTAGLGDTFANYFSCSIMGCKDSNNNPAKTGMLPYVGQTIAFMYKNNPVPPSGFMADFMENIGFPTVKQTQAQGIGYRALEPMLDIWKAFRNLAYSVYIIIFVVIGFMIMFRTKVNAQTIVSIQSALPNLIITLVLITFSYAIVGLLIDIMYFSIYLIVYLAAANNLVHASTAITHLMSSNAWQAVFKGRADIVGIGANAFGDIVAGLTLGDSWKGIVVEAASSGIAYLVIAAALAIQMFKLVWSLWKAYIMVIVQTVTAPVQILMNAMPGSNSFVSWLKRTASYLAPFPVVAAMFLFAAIIMGSSNTYSCYEGKSDCNPFGVSRDLANGENLWFPPFIVGSHSNAEVDTEDLLALLGLAIVLMTPQAVKMAQDALQVKESPYGAEVFAGIGTGARIAQTPIGWIGGWRRKQEARREREESAGLIGEAIGNKLSR